MTLRNRCLMGFLVAGAALAVYAAALGNELVFDDREIIANNLLVRDPWQVVEIFTSPYWGNLRHAEIYRPLSVWTLAVNYRLNEVLGLPGGDVYGYHLVNALLHAGVCLLLYRLAAALSLSDTAALLAGLIFAVHPIHTEAVVSPIGRAECLAALFGLAFLLFQRREEWGVAAGCLLLAMWSKESGIAFLGLGAWWDACRENKKRIGPWREYALYALVAGGWLLLRSEALEGLAIQDSVLDNPLAGVGMWPRLATAMAVQFEYLKLQGMPVGLSSDYSAFQIEVVESVWHGKVLGFALVVAGAVALTWRYRRSASVLPFAVGGYAILFSPTANFLFPIGTIMGERLAYAPSLMVCLLMGWVWGIFAEGRRVAGWIGPALVLLLWSGMSVARNGTWADEARFHRAQVRSAPRSARAQFGMGTVFLERGEVDSAAVYLRRGLEIYSRFPEVWYNLGLALDGQGRLREAERAFARAAAENGSLAEVWYNLGLMRQRLGEVEGAVEAYERAIRLKGDDVAAWFNLGRASCMAGNLEGALQAFRRVNELRPDLEDGWLWTGRVCEDLGLMEEAGKAYERAGQR